LPAAERKNDPDGEKRQNTEQDALGVSQGGARNPNFLLVSFW
jgi:hypothetical protein